MLKGVLKMEVSVVELVEAVEAVAEAEVLGAVEVVAEAEVLEALVCSG